MHTADAIVLQADMTVIVMRKLRRASVQRQTNSGRKVRPRTAPIGLLPMAVNSSSVPIARSVLRRRSGVATPHPPRTLGGPLPGLDSDLRQSLLRC